MQILFLLFLICSLAPILDAVPASPAANSWENNQEKKEPEENKKKEDQEKKNTKDKEPDPSKLLKIGNLAFPVSQQPTPLVSFGQNLVAEGQFIYQLQASNFQGKNEYFIEVSNSVIYAFQDNLSIFIFVPHGVRFRQGNHHSTGIEDLIIEFEYAPYTEEFKTFYDQISIVSNISIPTGSHRKNPLLGKGANSFFIGAVYSTMGINWFSFVSYGGIFNASSHRMRAGNRFLYQYGVGRRIWSNANWLLDWMVEFDGEYVDRDIVKGIINKNSGGNLIYATPSIFLSKSKHFAFQFGVGFPLIQQLYGRQNRKEYSLQTKVSWSF